MKEIWKEVPGYDGKYEVSNLGRVKSFNSHPYTGPKIMVNSVMRNGYARVELSKNKSSKTFLVHRLIATVFIPNPDNKRTVNHINGNKLDNRVENLEWATDKENRNHYLRKIAGEPYQLKSGRDKKCMYKKVVCIETGEVFESIASAARFAGVHERLISSIVNGDPHRHRAGGYHWKLY